MTPLPNIARHVVKTKRIGVLDADGVGLAACIRDKPRNAANNKR